LAWTAVTFVDLDITHTSIDTELTVVDCAPWAVFYDVVIVTPSICKTGLAGTLEGVRRDERVALLYTQCGFVASCTILTRVAVALVHIDIAVSSR
jgi:hypothetical protein